MLRVYLETEHGFEAPAEEAPVVDEEEEAPPPKKIGKASTDTKDDAEIDLIVERPGKTLLLIE